MDCCEMRKKWSERKYENILKKQKEGLATEGDGDGEEEQEYLRLGDNDLSYNNFGINLHFRNVIET